MSPPVASPLADRMRPQTLDDIIGQERALKALQTGLDIRSLGYNIFNPALVGRAFVLISFAKIMTTFVAPVTTFMAVDAKTTATPLVRAALKFVAFSVATLSVARFRSP